MAKTVVFGMRVSERQLNYMKLNKDKILKYMDTEMKKENPEEYADEMREEKAKLEAEMQTINDEYKSKLTELDEAAQEVFGAPVKTCHRAIEENRRKADVDAEEEARKAAFEEEKQNLFSITSKWKKVVYYFDGGFYKQGYEANNDINRRSLQSSKGLLRYFKLERNELVALMESSEEPEKVKVARRRLQEMGVII